jgi:hypothetical protein
MTMTSSALPPQVAGLWPAPAKVEARRSTRAGETAYFVVPSIRRPRYLVPTDVPGAERMFARHGGGRADRAARIAWRRAHRSGMAEKLPLTRLSVGVEPEGIEAYLSAAVDQPVRIGVLLGPPRANQKPVVQIFSSDGETIAFAKLGMTPLSAALLDTEASALSMLQTRSTTTFMAPELVHHGVWKGVPVLVQGALRLAQSDQAPTTPPVEVMVEIAGLDGITAAPLGESSFLAEVAPPDDVVWHGVDVSPLVRLHDGLGAWGDVGFGCWHGDFGPWNMGRDAESTEVWDWERFERGVPVGLDAAHYQAQRGVAVQAEPAAAWRLITADVRAVLRSAGLDASAAPAVAAAYLLAIVARYRSDAGAEPTPALRRRMAWLSSVAAIALAQIQETGP